MSPGSDKSPGDSPAKSPGDFPAKSEGGLSRWSRRKRAGGGAEGPVAGPPPVSKRGGAAPVAVSGTVSETVSKTGGLSERGFVKPLPPLAEPEEGEPAYAAAADDALALLDPQNAEAAALKAFPMRPGDEGFEDGNTDGEDVELTPEQQHAVENLPAIESLDKDSDFTPFFGPNVPDFLKRKAYKALWMSSPLFGFRDGLNDYDENFRVIDKLITAADSDYIAGKGYDFKDDEEEKQDSGAGDGGGDAGDGDGDGAIVADAESGDENGGETADADAGKIAPDTPKEPRKSDVRPPDDAV